MTPPTTRKTEELYLANEKLAFGALQKYFPSWANDDDIQQIAKLALWQACLNWDPEKGPLSTMAYICVRRAVGNHLRRDNAVRRGGDRKHMGPRPMSLDAEIHDSDSTHPRTHHEEVAGEKDVDYVDRDAFLSELTEVERRVFLLFEQGYSCTEIAERLGCTHQAVNQARSRYRKRALKLFDL